MVGCCSSIEEKNRDLFQPLPLGQAEAGALVEAAACGPAPTIDFSKVVAGVLHK